MPAYSRDEELLACLAFIKARGMGPKTWQKIFNHYDSPAQALDHCRDWQEHGLIRKNQLESFISRSWEREAEHELEYIARKNLTLILWTDPEYPERLRQISNPPALLYYRGDASLLENYSLAVVGSRQCSRYGLEMAMNICRDISAAGMSIVSGFAYGIDRQAHLASVDNPGGTVAVLGTGIDLIYPAMNKDLWARIAQKGLIITEFCPGTKPDAGNFPFRNRIISGISLGVLVVQSAIKSGSMITAQLALDQNKEVFAVPGAVNMDNYDGCNHLIKQGAHLVQKSDDVLEVLAPMIRGFSSPESDRIADRMVNQKPEPLPDLSGDEKEITQKLNGQDQTHIDELTKSLGWSSQKVSQVLVLLEIKGLVRRVPGMYYSLI
ncbi:MAG: DNA-processing protein DprA [Desulfonatronovibrio sp.]